MKKAWLYILFGILLLAFIPRAIEMLSGNFVFGFDQGKHWLAAKSIVVDHIFPLIGDPVGGAGGFFQGPGWYYLMAIFIFLWHGNPQGSIVLMVLAGLATVGLAFVFFRKIFGLTEAIFVGLLLAISPAIIIQSRFAWPPFIIPPLTVLYFLFLYRFISKKSSAAFWLFFIVGLMAHFEIATCLTLCLPTFLVSLAVAIVQKISFKKIFYAPLGFLLALSPHILFDFRHHFLNFYGIVHMAGSGKSLPFNAHISSFSSNMFGAFETLPVASWAVILLVILVFSTFLFDRLQSKKNKIFLLSLLLIPIMVFVEFLGFRSQMWEWWILELPVFYIAVTGIVLSYVWKKLFVGKIIVGVIFVYILVLFTRHTITYYRHDFNDFGGTQKIKGKVAAITYIFDDSAGKPFGLLVFTPPVYTYPYDFVSWWLGTTKYQYVPKSEKMSTFYLLIEQDGEKPWSYKGWEETVVKTGTVVWQKTLPSGFIVEKRTQP